MNARRAPPLARLLLRRFGGRYSESLEGDMLEEFAAGRSALWCWHQVGSALVFRARSMVRQRLLTVIGAALFFLLALSSLAPATAPFMGWARTLEPMRLLLQLAWLIGVPFLLGGLAEALRRERRIGAIALGAAFAYMTPITAPFDSAVCDLCVGPGPAVVDSFRWIVPLGSTLLAGMGAWTATKIPWSEKNPSA